MQGIWKDMPHPFSRLQRKSIRMQRKLFLYWLSMLLVIFSIFLVVLHIAGVFSALDKEMNQLLSARQKSVMTDLSYQLGKMTAQGISVSEQSSAVLSNILFTDPITSLHDQPERIGELESLLYGHLTTALRSTPCSGAYLVLDATTNTQAPGAQNSRAGLYLRLANLCSKSAANQDIVFYRGVADVAREHQLELHNRWKLEFDISNLPGYDAMLDLPPERLAESAVWTPRICLPGTWENVMILMVPIRGNDGTVMGVCGLELSELYFMLSYPSEQSNLGSMVTLLAPINGDSLPLSQAMTGRLGDTYLDTEDTLQIKEGKYFAIGDLAVFGVCILLIAAFTIAAFSAEKRPGKTFEVISFGKTIATLPLEEDAEYLRRRQTEITILITLSAVAGLLFLFVIYRMIVREIERRRRLAEEARMRQYQMERDRSIMDAENAGMEVSMSVEERRRMELQENAVNMAKEHPENVALLIRTWLMEE